MKRRSSLVHECLAELIGTFILVFFGTGVVHASVLTGAQSGLWQVAIVWGVAISLAIYAIGAISGAHINPAMTLAFAALRGFPKRKVPAYLASQLAGAFLAAAVLYVLFASALVRFEAAHGLTRGGPGSELSAMVYGEYFPNPAVALQQSWSSQTVSLFQAMLAEALGTAFLAFFVFAVTESANTGAPGRHLAPVFIGLTVAILISVIAPLTQAGFNPARDFGPRLFACMAGWGSVAVPGPRGGFFTVYILSPVVGALAGAGCFQCVTRKALLAISTPRIDCATERTSLPMSVKKTRLVLVGGFLGAGKTTLLWEAARRLAAQGLRIGLITNDQAPDLVDTHLLTQQGLNVEEVAGSCFCCNFKGLIAAADKLRHRLDADVLIAEPVGSCTDLSATILQPLKDRFHQEFTVAPLSVLLDPARIQAILAGETASLHPSAAYILRKQLEEADVIVINKIDTLNAEQLKALQQRIAEAFPKARVQTLSSQTGDGVDAWLTGMLARDNGGTHLIDVDYDLYAEGEAVLGWLNARIDLAVQPDAGVHWPQLCRDLMESLKTAFVRNKAPVGHVKCLLTSDAGYVVSNLTQLNEEVRIRDHMLGRPSKASLIVNARVEMEPDVLKGLIRDSLTGLPVRAEIRTCRSLRPGRPQPTYRYGKVV
jgi:MIP family channel proteins